MTYAELREALNTLTPEQLASDVVWWGEERGGTIDRLMILDEDWVDDDGEGAVPRSAVDAPEDAEIAWPEGTPILCTDEES